MRPDHEPDPEFVDRLEWQLRSALRRSRNGHAATTPPTKERARRWYRTAAIVTISVLAGFASATAAQELSARRSRELLTLQAEGVARIAELRTDMARRQLLEVRKRVDAGTVAERELAGARLQLARAEREHRRAMLDLEEIALSSEPPRDDLAAPLVAGVDFVLERLRLQLEDVQHQERILHQQAEETRRREAVGAAGTGAAVLESDLKRLASEIRVLEQELRLRDEFVAGEATEREVLARRDRARAEAAVEASALRERALGAELERLRSLVAGGVAPEAALEQLEYQLELAHIELEMADLELRYVDERWQQESGGLSEPGSH